MKSPLLLAAAALVATPPAFAAPLHARTHAKAPAKTPAKVRKDKAGADGKAKVFFHPSEVRSTGTVVVGG
ncbi:MAG TPA: hypothetical protein VN106_05300, partial [Sphingomicrobium sp.]|nr:hypothetical protein [Sphingomicrobium sp.]